jgi:hypothetical protein
VCVGGYFGEGEEWIEEMKVKEYGGWTSYTYVKQN